MGWDSERLSNLPKVTKLVKAAEPQANPVLIAVSLPPSQNQDSGQAVHLPFSGSES